MHLVVRITWHRSDAPHWDVEIPAADLRFSANSGANLKAMIKDEVLRKLGARPEGYTVDVISEDSVELLELQPRPRTSL